MLDRCLDNGRPVFNGCVTVWLVLNWSLAGVVNLFLSCLIIVWPMFVYLLSNFCLTGVKLLSDRCLTIVSWLSLAIVLLLSNRCLTAVWPLSASPVCIKEDPGNEPDHQVALQLGALESRLDYMGSSVLMARISHLSVRLRDEWKITERLSGAISPDILFVATKRCGAVRGVVLNLGGGGGQQVRSPQTSSLSPLRGAGQLGASCWI